MRDEELRAKLERLTGNARVALGLACASRALKAFEGGAAPDIYERGREALRDAWAWETERGVTPRRLYEHIQPLLAFERRPEVSAEPRRLKALFSVISALYFTTRAADGYAFQREGEPAEPLPNDIAEVSLQTLVECMDYAARADADEEAGRRWQQAALERLLGAHAAGSPGDWGEAVGPEYFEAALKL